MNFSQERYRYTYTGTSKLYISEEDRFGILQPKQTTYSYLNIDDRRKHFERIHKKFANPSTDPVVIHFYNKETNNVLLLQPISHYHHPYYTSDIHYSFNESFIIHNNLFKDGYRDICVNVLDNLVSRYSRFFFVYLSGDKYEFRFSEGTLRKLLKLKDKYKKRNSINNILNCVQNELKSIDIDFDYSYCTEAEWKEYKQIKDNPTDQLPKADNRKKNKKNKVYTKSFYFRAKGMEKYRIPKGMQSVFSRDVAENREYGMVRTFFNRDLKMTDNYILEKWDYMKRYVDKWGAQALINFSAMKMKEMAKQKKKPRNPKSVLMSLIVNIVNGLNEEGRGETTLFSIPQSTEYNRYDPRGKSVDEIVKYIEDHYTHPPDTS